MRRFPTLPKVGFFSYLGYLCLGAIPWPWSLAPTLGLVQNSLEQTVVCFWVHFVLEIAVLEHVEPAECVYYARFCVHVVFFFLARNLEKNPVFMIISWLSNMQFYEDNVGICMLFL